MGSFVINGLADSRGADKIDPRIVDIIRTAAASSPYDVELFSGKRFGNGASRHDHGNAVDIVLLDPRTGKEVPNLGAGGAAFEAYEGFAKTAREAQQARYPELKNSFRWGGYFGPSTKNPSGFDAMHFDIKPGGAMRYGSWKEGLHNRSGGLDAFKKLGAGMTYSSQGQNLGDMPQDAIQTALVPTPPNREAGLDDDVLHTAALTLLGEAAGEGRKGMEAVANVFGNRVASSRYPDNLLDVVKQKNKKGVYQFSAWNEGKGGNAPDKRYSRDDAIYQQARATAADVLSGRVADPTNGGLAYFAGKEPYWFNEENKNGTVRIGNHTFLKGNGSKPSTALAAIEDLSPTKKTNFSKLSYAPEPPVKPAHLTATKPKSARGPQRNAKPNFFQKVGGYNNFKMLERQLAQPTQKVASAVGNSILDTGRNVLGGAQKVLEAQKPVQLPRPRPVSKTLTPPPRPKGLGTRPIKYIRAHDLAKYGVALPTNHTKPAPKLGGQSQAQIPLKLPNASQAQIPLTVPPKPLSTRNFDRAEAGFDVPYTKPMGKATINPTPAVQTIAPVGQQDFLQPPVKPQGLGRTMTPLQQVQTSFRQVLAPIRNLRHDAIGQVQGMTQGLGGGALSTIQQALGNRPSHTISLDRAASNGNIIHSNGYIYAGSPGNFKQVGKVKDGQAKMHSSSNEKPKGYRYYDPVKKQWMTK